MQFECRQLHLSKNITKSFYYWLIIGENDQQNCYDRKQLNYMDFLVIAKIENLLSPLLLSECIIIINMFSRVFGIIATMQQQKQDLK